MRVIDVNTMKLSTLDVTWDYQKEKDFYYSNQSVEWHGKVYMLGDKHIHVIAEDCKKYECIKNHGYYYLK
jgi:hypothetical protein